MHALDVRGAEGQCSVEVFVKPRASRTRLVGVREGALEVAVKALPAEGEANRALIAFIADCVGVRQRDVTIRSGQSSRSKIIDILGLSPSEFRLRLSAAESNA